MRIVVNDIAASKTGALSILTDFYHYVATNDTENEWIFLVGGDYIKETERIKVRIMTEVKSSWLNRLKFDLITGSTFIKALNPDVVFSLQNTLTCGYKGKQILYVHQPLGFQTIKKFSFFKKNEREYAIYQYFIGALINHSVRKADKVIVQTDWMKEAVAGKAHVSPTKIAKILPDVENLNRYKRLGVRKPNQFFFPSGVMIYKNHECILKACNILNQKGITDFNVLFTLDSTESVTTYHYNNQYNNITCNGRLTKEQVLEVYNERTLIFPSYIETFGYPPAEARQLEAPILASDTPFCHEVLTDYPQVNYFDPFHPEELARLMEQAINGTLPTAAATGSANHSIINSEDQKSLRDSWGEVLKELL